MIDLENKKEVAAEKTRGDRGELGKSSAGDRIKVLHRAEGRGVSLKVFARNLAKSGNQDAKDWFECKKGAMNQNRNDANIKAAMECRVATKAAKRKKKGQQ